MNRSFMLWPGFRRKALTLSYDDGTVYDKRLVEILDKNGIKCTFNLNSGKFGLERRMSREDTLSLFENSDHEVAVHGAYHVPLDRVSDPLVINDVINDRISLEEMFGRVIQGMAYPFGTYNDSVIEDLKRCGIKYARTISKTESFDLPDDFLRWDPTCSHAHPRLMELAHEFVERGAEKSYIMNSPLLFYLWGHSYQFNDNDNWHVIEEFAEFMGRRDDIWYATNIEISRYTEAYDRLEYSAGGTMIYNPTNIDVYVGYFTGTYLIKAGETVKVEPKR